MDTPILKTDLPKTELLKTVSAAALPLGRYSPIDQQTLNTAAQIIAAVRSRKDVALVEFGQEFQELAFGQQLFVSPTEIESAVSSLTPEVASTLQRTAERIRSFASAQRASLKDIAFDIPEGKVGHRWQAVDVVGCYAPGGRYPLPSSVLMTVITAKVAGAKEVWLASPRPSAETLAAAFISGASGVLRVGGAHAIAGLAFGTASSPRCDLIVGPGNKFVTAAKQLLSGEVGIDMLAGPSELLIIADSSADPAFVAADLLAQAEHDPDSLPILLALEADTVKNVNLELGRQLAELSTRAVAEQALKNGFAVLVDSVEQAIEISNRLAPEHLQIMVEDASAVAARCRNYGAVFIGQRSAEVFGDYGAGPNHVLPTSGTARFAAGLSVFTFLKARTFLQVDEKADISELVSDTQILATCEGLVGHNAAARIRALL